MIRSTVTVAQNHLLALPFCKFHCSISMVQCWSILFLTCSRIIIANRRNLPLLSPPSSAHPLPLSPTSAGLSHNLVWLLHSPTLDPSLHDAKSQLSEPDVTDGRNSRFRWVLGNCYENERIYSKTLVTGRLF